MWVSGPLVPGLVSYQLLDTPEGASDHHGLVVVLDTAKFMINDPWMYT
jgi:hypothetical protein